MKGVVARRFGLVFPVVPIILAVVFLCGASVTMAAGPCEDGISSATSGGDRLSPEELRVKLADTIEVLLDDIDEELGGCDPRVSLIKKKLDRLLNLDRDLYNSKADEDRIDRDSPDFDYEQAYQECASLTDKALIRKLHQLVDNHHDVGYRQARRIVFLKIDNIGGTVEGVYTGRKLEHVTTMPNSSNMNIEHTWPQSMGATGTAKSDMHHLFPCDSKANSIRGNLPFGIVTNPNWEKGGSKRGNGVFQPRPCHRGNVARAIFYFAVRYGKHVDPRQESVLRQWNHDDPVDAAERARNDKVFEYQHNRNPFVDHPEFIDAISDF